MSLPKITFGIIVLNAEPFIEHCIRSLYPFAHEIIVVEGAYEASAHLATQDGHSADDTLGVIRRFQEQEDPQGMVRLVTRDGLWDGLTQQSQAYAEHATGAYLWQVDCDEFYLPRDMQTVMDLLAADPSIAMMTFKAINFVYDIKYRLVSGRDFQRDYIEYRRLFKFGPGYRYTNHEPPTVLDPQGRDVATINHWDKHRTARQGIYMYHLWAILRDKVLLKAGTYARRDWGDISRAMPSWAENWEKLTDPFHLQSDYSYRTWIERFQGPFPPEVLKLMDEVHNGPISDQLRDTTDVETLLSSWSYRLRVLLVVLIERCRGLESRLHSCPGYMFVRRMLQPLVNGVRRLTGRSAGGRKI
jgi:glycosyltransferase involved in cell wall biosynthesis